MILRWGAEAALPAFVAKYGFQARNFGPCRALWGIEGDGKAIGAVIVHDWNPEAETVEISALSRDARFPTRKTAKLVLAYCFERMACQAVVAKTDASNTQVRRWAKALGADEYIIPRLRGRMASEAILVMTQEAWAKSRWAGKHEITIPPDAA